MVTSFSLKWFLHLASRILHIFSLLFTPLTAAPVSFADSSSSSQHIMGSVLGPLLSYPHPLSLLPSIFMTVNIVNLLTALKFISPTATSPWTLDLYVQLPLSISPWMSSRQLKWNIAKSALLIFPPQTAAPSFSPILVNGSSVLPVAQAKMLDIIVNSSLFLISHTQSVIKYYWLFSQNILRILTLFPPSPLKLMV